MKHTPEQLTEILTAHEKWIAGYGGVMANLPGANFSGANLHGADLSEADLHCADFSGANLHGADLSEADLSEANLHGADLSEADLSEADFSGANFSGANLHGADLHGNKIERLIARITRIIDPYEFFAWRTDKGDFIKAGCRFLTCAEYRAHVASDYPGTPKAAETLRILDFIEAAFTATPRKTKTEEPQ